MLQFAVLGPMLVSYDEKPIDLPTAMLRRLVAILLCQPGQPIPIDLLLEALWEGQPPPSARKTLQIYVHRLRRVLGEGRVLRGPTGYTLSLENAEVDSLVFADLVRRGNEASSGHTPEEASELYGKALGLWRGDAFADILGCTHVANQARQLDQSRLHTLEQYAEIELRLGRHGHMIGWLAPAVAANPYLEKLRAQLILALYRSGRQADALAEYRRLHHQLIEELGVEPGPELRQLHERMLRNDPDLRPEHASATSATPAQLPLAPYSFAGRTDELAELDRLLALTSSRDRVTIVALTGPAGVGKTATALSWAHRITGQFPDGQLYANLRGFDPFASSVAPTDVLRGFLGALGVPNDRIPADIEAQTALFRSLLASRTMLVLLDNVLDAAHVRPLLPGAGRSMVLVTSRNPLTGLVVAEGAHPIALRLLTEPESRELMTGRLGGRRINAEPEATRQIVQRCAGLPLALAVIAARAQIGPEVTLTALASGLDREITLDAFSADDPLTDVRAVFSWSYKALDPVAALVFRLSAVHPGPDFAVDTMADLALLSRAETEAALRELVEAQLCTLSAPGRHGVHDLLRAYATELFGQMKADEALQARQRLLDHYLHVACDAALAFNKGRLPIPMPPRPEWLQGVTFSSPAEACDWFTAELAALDAAFRMAAGSGLDGHVWRIAWAVADLMTRQSRWAGLERVHEMALSVARRSGDAHGCGYAYRYLGVAAFSQGHLERAYDLQQRSLQEFAEAGLLAEQAVLYNDLSAFVGHEDHDVLHCGKMALKLAVQAGYHAGEAHALNNIAMAHLYSGNYEKCLRIGQLALAKIIELEDEYGSAAAWATVGSAHHRLGDLPRAIAAFEQAVALHRRIGRQPYLADHLVELGDIYLANGDADEASRAWQEAQEIHRRLGTLDDDLAEKVRQVSAGAGRS